MTSNGTLNLQWTIAPTASDFANAIVKRDSLGNFAAHIISALAVQATTVSSTTVSGTTVSGTNSALGPFSSAVIGINQATGVVNGFGVLGIPIAESVRA